MSYYVPSYDTEAIYPWWELGGKPYSAKLYQDSVSYDGKALEECLRGIEAVANTHRELSIPATFFIVANLAKNAGSDLFSILGNSLFDIQSHSYTHANLTELTGDKEALVKEIVDSKHVLEDTFGREVIGFTTPGSFTRGLTGKNEQLKTLWDAGYRYVRSVGKGPFDTVPAPLTQPFWYSRDGFPDLLELGLHAWHDTVLTGQPFAAYWPPVLPWGFPQKVPESPEEVYDVYAQGIEYIVAQNLLTYLPCFHPWCIYRVDQKAKHISLLLTHAKKNMEIVSCTSLYSMIKNQRSLATENPDLPEQ